MVDKHGEKLKVGDRVMVDGALTGTVANIEAQFIGVEIDGENRRRIMAATALGWQATELESLGDGINQAMRAAQGQPS